jgi:hypothetical protein
MSARRARPHRQGFTRPTGWELKARARPAEDRLLHDKNSRELI